jgi:hypothetical protein
MESEGSLLHLQCPPSVRTQPIDPVHAAHELSQCHSEVPQIDSFFLCDSEYCVGDGWTVEPVISFLNGLLNIAVLGLIACAKKHDW